MHGQPGLLQFPALPRTLALAAGLAAAVGTIPSALLAQDLDVPVNVPKGDGQAADCASSTVSGLDPAGDNFLAVRSGPGAQHRKIDELHTGDVVITCDMRGDWIGIFYKDGHEKSGWVHGNYLTDLAG